MRATARALLAFMVMAGLLVSMPMSMPDVEAAREIKTFEDGSNIAYARITTDPLPEDRATVYFKLKADVKVADASMNVSSSLLTRGWQVGAGGGLAGLSTAIDVSGDLNADGFNELVVSAPATTSARGWAAVVLGRGTGYQLPEDASWTGTANYDWLGWAIDSGGDLDGDGFDDLLMSRLEINPSPPAAATGTGEVAIWWGGAQLSAAEDETVSGLENGEMFGFSISTDGDVNGDGDTDLVVGAPRNILNDTVPGKAYVYLCDGTRTLPSSPNNTVTGAEGGDGFGTQVHICGDVNDDGYDDVLVTAPGHNSTGGQWDAGRAYVFFGGANGIGSTPNWTLEGTSQRDLLGWSGIGLGDANDDGYGDIAIGVPLYDNGTVNDTGAAMVFYGSSTGPSTSPDLTLTTNITNAFMGADINTGDINNDTLGDLLVGAPGTDNGTLASAGHVQVHFGDKAGISATPIKILRGWVANGDMGDSIGTGGDGNGDGYDDIIVGDTIAQYTYVFYGGAGAPDPKVYIDDQEIWSTTGLYQEMDQIFEFADEINAYIQSHQHLVDDSGFILVPINVSMSKQGQLKFSNMTITYYKLVKPTGLTATPTPTGGSITLRWDDHTTKVDDVTNIVVEQWNGTDWEEVTMLLKNSVSYLVTDLTDGVAYQFRLRAYDNEIDAYGVPSVVVIATPADTKLPDKIANVQVTGDRVAWGVNITWSPSDEDTVNYEVWSNKTGEWEVLANVSAPQTWFIDTAVDDGPRYYYKVRAWDEVPQPGELSNIANGYLDDVDSPEVPSGFAVQSLPSGRSLELSWLANTDDTEWYSIESNKTGPWREVILLRKDTLTYIDKGLQDGLMYYYRLAARDESGNPSAYTPAVPGVPKDEVPPAPPEDLQAIQRPEGNVLRLTWELNIDDAQWYRIFLFNTSSDDWEIMGEVFQGIDQYDVVNLENGVSYRLRIKAVDGALLESDWSNEVTATPVDTHPPTIPAGMDADLDPLGGAINLSWEPNDDDTVAYKVLRWDNTDWLEVAIVPHPTTYYYDSGLTNNQPYAYVTRAIDESDNESPNSQRVDAIPKDSTPPEKPRFLALPLITNVKDLTIEGVCEEGATITLSVNLIQQEPVPCDAEGRFSIQVRLKNGPNEIQAKAEDDSGTEIYSDRVTVRVDIQGPKVDRTEPVSGTRDVSRLNLTIQVFFSEEIDSSSIKCFLRKGTHDTASLVQSIGDTDNIVPDLKGYNDARYLATFEVMEALDSNTDYSILIYGVVDPAGNLMDHDHEAYSFTLKTAGTGGDGGGGGTDDGGIGSIGLIAAAVIIIVLVIVVALFVMSRSGTHEEVEVDREIMAAPVRSEESPDQMRPDIQDLYADAYEERGEAESEHHEVGGLGDWLAEQESASQEADLEARKLATEMQTTESVPVDESEIEQVPPGLLAEMEHTPDDLVAEPEVEAELEPEDEAEDEPEGEPEDEPEDETGVDEDDDAATLLDELEEELEAEAEKEE